MFARMSVRGMTPEQFFDSLSEASDYVDPYGNNPQDAVPAGQRRPAVLPQAFLRSSPARKSASRRTRRFCKRCS